MHISRSPRCIFAIGYLDQRLAAAAAVAAEERDGLPGVVGVVESARWGKRVEDWEAKVAFVLETVSEIVEIVFAAEAVVEGVIEAEVGSDEWEKRLSSRPDHSSSCWGLMECSVALPKGPAEA